MILNENQLLIQQNTVFLNEDYHDLLSSDKCFQILSNLLTVSKIIPGGYNTKLKLLDSAIDKYELNIKNIKLDLKEYRSLSDENKAKKDKLNKIDSIITSCLKIGISVAFAIIDIKFMKNKSVFIFKKIKDIKKLKLIKTTLGSSTALAKSTLSITNNAKNATETLISSKTYETEILKALNKSESLLLSMKKLRNDIKKEQERQEKNNNFAI